MLRTLVLTCLLAAASLALQARASFEGGTDVITYTVNLDRRSEQLADIEMTVPAWKDPTLTVHLPVWRPGRYEVLDASGTLRSLTAADASGASLAVEKIAKSSWRIATPAPGDVTVRYRLYANSIGNRTRHVDDTHAFLSGASVFLYCHERRDSPLKVKLGLPAGWRIACGLETDPADAATLTATDYDQLVDSPIEAGIQTTRTIVVEGVPHEFAFWGRTDVVPDSIYDDAAKVIKVQHDLFGSFPHRRYVFMTHIAPGIGGGTEHVNSTILQARPTAFDSARDRRNFLALVSHEYFHTWNVKNFRPKGLKPYDYDRENYTNLLWVAEGTTTYYDELMCVRAGVWTPSQYLESLARTIDEETTRPGAQVQSLESASFDAWVKFNRPTPDSVNSTVSFYSKGALVNFLLDASIRTRTGNAKSLDDVMRALNEGFALHSPHAYSTADLLAILKSLTGEAYDDFFASYVAGTAPIDATEALAVFGLERTREKADDDSSGDAWAGLDVRDGDGAAVVTTVRAGGPAAGSGVITDDQIVAIDGIRVRAGDFDARIRRLAPGTQATLTLFRRDEMRTVTITLGERRKAGGAIRRRKDASAAQKAAYEHWLGTSWEP